MTSNIYFLVQHEFLDHFRESVFYFVCKRSYVFNYYLLHCLNNGLGDDLEQHLHEGQLMTLFYQCMTIGEPKLDAKGRTPKTVEHLREAFDELNGQPGEAVSSGF